MTTPRGPIIEDVTDEATDPGTDRPGGEVPENPGTPEVRPSENPPVEDSPGGGVEESKSDEPSVSSALTASAERVQKCAWQEFQEVDDISKCKCDEIDTPTLTDSSTAIQIKRATMNLKMFNVMMITCTEVLGMDMEFPSDKEEEFIRFGSAISSVTFVTWL